MDILSVNYQLLININMNKSFLQAITGWKVLVPAFLLIAIAVIAATFVAKSNTDYICTHIIDDESACVIDEWGPWTDIGSGDPEPGAQAGTTYQVQQKRIGTGTKTLSRVIQYINRRTACEAGFERTGTDGSGGGAGGYKRGGKTFTTSAVCQIEETRTITRKVPSEDDPECTQVGDIGCDLVDPNGDVIRTETVGTTTTGGDEVILDGIDIINEYRHSMIKAEISAVPALVSHDGDTTEIRWKSQETKHCTVTGDNGDSWTPEQDDARTSGTETSSQIHGRTVYTLTCTAFDDTTVTDTAIVDRIPNWQEQ